jgi:hypothetical protein
MQNLPCVTEKQPWTSFVRRRRVVQNQRPGWRGIFIFLALIFLVPFSARSAQVLVPTGSIWKYLDNGSDQGTAWRLPGFNDSAWASGRAELGYGDGDETTVINGGPANNRFVTSYFRHTVTVSNRGSITNLAVRLLRDDGGVVYLNGVEVFRSNMPEGPINYRTFASRGLGVPDEQTFVSHAILPDLLFAGTNLLAVEIHQASRTSTDVSFDLELLANTPLGNLAPAVRFTYPQSGAVFQIGEAASLKSEAVDLDGVVTRMELYEGTRLVAGAFNPALSWVFSTNVPGFYTFTARAFDNAGAVGVSKPLVIAVAEPGRDMVLFPGFATTHGLILQGAAGLYEDVLRLNPSSGGMGGGWIARKLFLKDGFEAEFQFQITEIRGQGADGFAFVIQGTPLPRLGQSGGELGYGTVTNSLAIEFDTFLNPLLNDPNGNHISIQSRGTAANSAHHNASLAHTTAIPNLKAGNRHTVRVDYTPGALRVYFDGAPAPVLSAAVDLDRLLNLDFGRGWAGFTAATGGHQEAHDVWSWWIKTHLPPVTVHLRHPVENAILPASSKVVLSAEASSSRGAITRVEFFLDGRLLGQASSPPFEWPWTPPGPGRYTFTLLATDEHGNQMMSAPVSAFSLVPNEMFPIVPRGSVWKYLDDGSDQGTAWRAPEFNDSVWASGPAELGYGDGDEATVVRGGPAGNRHITTYFRHAFLFPEPSGINHLVVHLLRDDGGVVYLNGTEIFRSNMPWGEIHYRTLASSGVGGADETTFFSEGVPAGLLRPGENVLAVEIHQNNPASTDISFDLELSVMRIEPRIERMDRLADGSWRLAFPTVLGRGYIIQYSHDLAAWIDALLGVGATGELSFWGDQGPPNTVRHPEEEPARFYRLVLEP